MSRFVEGRTFVPIYSLSFAKHLASIASRTATTDSSEPEAGRTILYLSLLSAEIALKAFLEQSGFTILAIRECSHSHQKILALMEQAEVMADVTSSESTWVAASRIRSVVVDERFANATIGTLLTTSDMDSSVYPGEVRYGEEVRHYPPMVMAALAETVVVWVEANINSARVKPEPSGA